MTRIDGYATLPHYLDHCAAVWRALPATTRGHFYTTPQLAPRARALGVVPEIRRQPPVCALPVLVAGWQDYQHTYGRPVALIEHGAGQAYQGVIHRAHPGGPQRGRVGLYLCPNQDVADRNLAAYPNAVAAVVGPSHLDRWHATNTNGGDSTADVALPKRSSIVVSWHFDSAVAPEARSAWPHYGPSALEQLRDRLGGRLRGHAHPRMLEHLRPIYAHLGIPIIETFDEVLDTAALYICDNSSTLFEAASCGIPVAALNAPWYRRDVHHGLRFWDHVPGPQVDHPEQLVDVVDHVLADPQAAVRSARPAVAVAYIACDGRSAHRASCAVGEWLVKPSTGVTR